MKIYFVFAVDNSNDSSCKNFRNVEASTCCASDVIVGLNTEILLWTIVECCIGLVCACIPCMTPLGRLVTLGPVTAFSAKKSSIKKAKHSRAWPGGRRLPSAEDSRVILAGTNHELGQWSDHRHLPSDITRGTSPEIPSHPATLAELRVTEADGATRTHPNFGMPKNAVDMRQKHGRGSGAVIEEIA